MTLIKSLTVGKAIFPVNIIQGPLAGVSCSPFRALTWTISKPAFCYTEMISCKTLLFQKKSNERFVHIDNKEGPVGFQLSGNDPKELAEATKLVTDQGASLVDLNCGCPVNKIRAKGAGSRLLQTPAQLYRLMEALKENTHLPVSIKIRVDGHSTDRFNHEIVKVVKDAGIDFITVHGRNWREGYDTPCHYDQIQFFVEELEIPVIGNGDISCLSSLQKMLATNCAGVMVGRASVGQPWLIGKLIAESQGAEYKCPTAPEIGKLFFDHVTALTKLLKSEKFAIIQARKFAKYYARDLQQKQAFIERINHCETLLDLEKVTTLYFM
ncbi:nitrogen regulation protein (plasmid) [Legionella adelaidensis]|uniref:tRNA-dihydrouridine synthase n=1 Tax=Legionella adelaidensis TaxID=45056 RepID=A0A0W0R3D3_9GAMM|nr:tRNA-dihydrouridine synthase family protein [Legionella adelaidensis]KTC65534.1 nitrogen regulation protein [Legionella adelaidensis]VEH84645.1 nitrogen regulation protein [Legionella adelaidensis]